MAAIAATTIFGLGQHGVSLVGVLPKGFPPLTLPGIRLADVGPLFAGALGIAVVSLASTASAFAARTGQEVHGNGEMIGIGVANVASGFSRVSRSAPAVPGRRWRNALALRASLPG
jgi:MFS superfamily sulfate permease-like transporter